MDETNSIGEGKDRLFQLAEMALKLEKERVTMKELPVTMERIQYAGELLDHVCQCLVLMASVIVSPPPQAAPSTEPLQSGDFIQHLEFNGDDLKPR